MVRLVGRIIKQTNKAVCFWAMEDEVGYLRDKVIWFPKSKIKQNKTRDGQEDVMYAQEWLYRLKIKYPPNSD